MNNRGVSIKYGDVAPGAKENFRPELTFGEITDFSKLELLNQYNVEIPNVSNPCELYQTVLDGSASAFPEVPKNENLGIWSEEVSDESGYFFPPLRLELTADAQYSSQGLTFTFDTDNNIYPLSMTIQWLRITDDGIEQLEEDYFEPDNAFYFCHKKVENYNKVVIVFYDLNMPHNRLKLRAIDFGYGTYFTGRDLRNVKISQNIDPISTEIAINTMDFTLDSKSNIEYSFIQKQPLSVYFNGDLIATTFVTKSSRKSKTVWDVQSEDYIGTLNDIEFAGDIYSEKNAVELLNEISSTANVPFEIDSIFNDITVSGYIPRTTCRIALMQVCFAIKAVADTSNSAAVKIFKISSDLSQEIPLERMYQGGKTDYSDAITAVLLSAHTYSKSSESIELYKSDEEDITDTAIMISFSEPVHSLSITNGTILEGKTNYAIIQPSKGCVLSGKKYNHVVTTYRKNNPVVAVDDLPKNVEIKDATLVSPNIAQDILEYCFKYLTATESASAKIVNGFKVVKTENSDGTFSETFEYDNPVNIGDIIKIPRGYLNDYTGRVISATYSLNGNIISKEVKIK